MELRKIIELKAKRMLKDLNIQTPNKKFTGGKVHHLDSINLREFLKSFKVAVVDFWAEWCPPCFLLAPVIEELANDYPNVGFGKINADENPDIASLYGIMSLPTLVFFKEGEPIDYLIGAVPREYIELKIKNLY